MRILCTGLAFMAVAAAAMAEAALDGRIIDLKAGEQMTVDAPFELPFDGTLGEGELIRVENPKTGREFPGTLRGGELVFVPDGAMPGSTHELVVNVVKDNAPAKVQVTKKEGANEIEVTIDDVPFTSYHYADDLRKPFLWPVLGSGGVHVTRDFPMGPKEESDDHPHHRSMWTSYGDVNGADCWMEGENGGLQVVQEVTFGSGDAYGWIHSKDVWTDHERKPIVDEEREYRFYASTPEARLFDVTVTFTANHGDVLFKDTKEGGIFSLRIKDEITAQPAKGGKGVITNAEGKTGEAECWGKPSAWCDMSGPVEGAGWVGVTVFDHPTNLRYPTCWHVRNYGLMGANCFGLSYFTKGEQNGDYTLKSGEKLTFNYRIYVHSGDVNAAKVADRYADYASPPKVAWSEKPNVARKTKQTVAIPGHERSE